ncbi:MAG: AarF/UbiB family protein [Clostridia bacterium]|nr:AarF/UbiB family protein [Clostridia bacterium]MDD4047570.1 AarF/UbiB family protein [Clostridia bacterium]
MAVKVQRPGIEKSINLDLNIMKDMEKLLIFVKCDDETKQTGYCKYIGIVSNFLKQLTR